MMCRIANVSRSGYYAYKKRLLDPSARNIQDKIDFVSIKAAYDYKDVNKGAKQIKMRLDRDYGICMNLKKIRRLMKKFDLICPIRKINPVKMILRAQQSNKTYSNVLNRHFRQGTAKKTLLTDISYIQYGSGKRAYISTIKDSSTKMILAWQISVSLDLSFVIKTVRLLLDMYKGELDLMSFYILTKEAIIPVFLTKPCLKKMESYSRCLAGETVGITHRKNHFMPS